MELGVVILNYNNYHDTIKCVDSILKNTSVDKIVIVDNNSSNISVKKIQNFIDTKNDKHAKKFKLIVNNLNLGYAKGNNIGVRYLVSKNAKYIAVLNNDIIVPNDVFRNLINKLLKNSSIGFISPLIIKNNKGIDYGCLRFDNGVFNLVFKTFFNINDKIKIENDEVECDILSGAFLLASSETWTKIDFFDEKTFLYFEENIIYEKLKLIKKNSMVLTDIFIIHHGGKTTSKLKNHVILKHQLSSLNYYLKEYKKINSLLELIIKFIFQMRIKIISLKNYG